MSDSQVLPDLTDSPESSSATHSWARQHGAKHRDFPASRLQARERARQRVQRAIEKERERGREQAESWRAAGVADPPRAQQQTPGSAQVVAAEHAAPPALTLEHAQDTLRLKSEPAITSPADQPEPQIHQQPASDLGYPSAPSEFPMRPAWLNSSPAPFTQAPPDTLQAARDRLASRWFALKGMFEGAAAALEPHPAPAAITVPPAPVLAVFSLAGGVGKSSLAATLARTLSARGERVLLVETAAFGLLPFFFGAQDRRPGVLRTFAPPEGSGDAPVQMIALDADSLAVNGNGHDPLTAEITRHAQGAGRIIVDIATASAAIARRVLRISPLLLVPLAPDMNSVVNAGFIDSVFQCSSYGPANSSEVYYVLNQFDPSLPLHLDVREILRERLGDRLLPFTLRHAPAVSEALAEGMTVLDFAPASPIAEDFSSLAAWIKARSAPAGAAARGTRWTEK